MNFWIPAMLIWLSLSITLYYWSKEKRSAKELKIKDGELKVQNNELMDFRNMHNKMYNDLRMAIDAPKQKLQEYEFGWDRWVDEIFRNARHDLKNKILDLTIDVDYSRTESIKEFFRKATDEILSGLQDLPNVISYEKLDIGANDVSAHIKASVPKLFRDKDKSNFDFTETDNFVAADEEKCEVNIYRVGSIVFNLLSNASIAISNKKSAARKLGERFGGHIWLNIDRTSMNGLSYITVTVQDNAGGFPPEIENKIYKESVPSAKEKNRIGEGSSYIKYFAKYMGCEIKAQNKLAEDGLLGAEVIFLIPIKQ
jgi:hypothetical protein